MFNLLITLAAAGAGYLLGGIGARRAVDARIDERLAEMEQRLRPQNAPPPPALKPVEAAAADVAPQPVAEPAATKEEEISPEVLTVISAAICAFLGKPARVRRVRRIPSGVNPWAQVGRVSVMASHALTRQH